MRGTLLSWLPEDMRGLRLLDAGCGTGALAMQAAQRGAEVVAIDLSPTLVQLAKDRLVHEFSNTQGGSISFMSGDMLSPDLGEFDHVIESAKVGLRKPDPRIYLMMCEALGVAPAACVYLDDLGINCKPAAALGMTAIKVTGEAQALADLAAATGLRF
jgi:2-polyprenyl-3-methyl-5-hydroxy-6-metoxy-1,4-benzoquinol methylase